MSTNYKATQLNAELTEELGFDCYNLENNKVAIILGDSEHVFQPIRKSRFVSFILLFFFGPFGLFYNDKDIAISMIFITIGLSIFTGGAALPILFLATLVLTPICMATIRVDKQTELIINKFKAECREEDVKSIKQKQHLETELLSLQIDKLKDVKNQIFNKAASIHDSEEVESPKVIEIEKTVAISKDICAECDTENAPGAKFCAECGESLAKAA